MSWRLAKEDIWLKVPFEEKDNAKNMGAKFDPEKKRWFCPRGEDPLSFRKYWRVLFCPYEKKNVVKQKGAIFDRNLKSWVIPDDYDFDKFTEFWPRDLKKYIFNERFVAHSLLAESGQSEVFYGYDESTGAAVAIKLYVEAQQNELTKTAFDRELHILFEILNSCENTLDIIDYGSHTSSDGLFIVTPYMPADLSNFIGLTKTEEANLFVKILLDKYDFENDIEKEQTRAEYKQFYKKELKKLEKLGKWNLHDEDLYEILSALVKVYRQGVLHRDIKPSNIFLRLDWDDEDDEVNGLTWMLGDFGAAKYMYQGTNKNGLTLEGINSVPYTPENSKLEMKFPETRDVYGWGALAVSVVCNKIFLSEDELRKALKSDFRKAVPSKIFSIISKCLAENPEDRFENVIKLTDALDLKK